MAKFASARVKTQPQFVRNLSQPNTTNLAGGQAFEIEPKEQIALLALNSFLQDQYYRSGNEATDQLAALCQRIEPEFLAKLALLTRHHYGMRSTSHVIAGEVSRLGSGTKWARRFFEKVVARPDDMLEIASYAISRHGYMSNAMKRGFRTVLEGLSAYHLMKYKGAGKFKMVDLINLTHPRSETVDLFMKGQLESADTWEVRMSAAGQSNGDKASEWESLLKDRKLGYLATLRNLRNIYQSGNENALKLACDLISDFREVQRTKIFPFQLYTAFVELEKAGGRNAAEAVMTALELSLSNVPQFGGKTLIALDSSGSMYGARQKNNRPVLELAAIYTAALSRMENATVIQFDTRAKPFNVRQRDSIATTTERLIQSSRGGGTSFSSVFDYAGNSWFDRIIFISDMQAWCGPTHEAYREYATRHGRLPFVHSFDLCGYGTAQFSDHAALYGAYSANVLSIMEQAETDPKVLVNQVEAYDL